MKIFIFSSFFPFSFPCCQNLCCSLFFFSFSLRRNTTLPFVKVVSDDVMKGGGEARFFFLLLFHYSFFLFHFFLVIGGKTKRKMTRELCLENKRGYWKVSFFFFLTSKSLQVLSTSTRNHAKGKKKKWIREVRKTILEGYNIAHHNFVQLRSESDDGNIFSFQLLFFLVSYLSTLSSQVGELRVIGPHFIQIHLHESICMYVCWCTVLYINLFS